MKTFIFSVFSILSIHAESREENKTRLLYSYEVVTENTRGIPKYRKI